MGQHKQETSEKHVVIRAYKWDFSLIFVRLLID